MTDLSRENELKLIGLKALADRHNRFLEEIKNAVAEIVGEGDEYGLSSDFVYGDDITVEQLWERTAALRP